MSPWSPCCRNLLWVIKNTLPNLHVHWSLYCSNLLWAIKNTSPTLHVHWPPYHRKRKLFWAIKNTPCRSIHSTIDHPIAATCSGQSITKIPSPSTPSVTTLLQKSAPGGQLPLTLHFYGFSLSTLLQISAPGHWINRKHWYSKVEEAAKIYASTWQQYEEGGHVPDACDNSGLIVDEQRMIHMPLKRAQMWRITFQCQSLEGQTAGDFPEIRSLYWFGCYPQQKIVVAVSPHHINLPTSHEMVQVHGMPPGKTLFCENIQCLHVDLVNLLWCIPLQV